jgi:hypothetical protein
MKYIVLLWLALMLAACSEDKPQAADPLQDQVKALEKAGQVEQTVQEAAQQQRREAEQE